MPPVGLEPTVSAGERPQTYALDRAASGIADAPTIAVYKFNIAPFETVEQIIERCQRCYDVCPFPFLTQCWVELSELDVTRL